MEGSSSPGAKGGGSAVHPQTRGRRRRRAAGKRRAVPSACPGHAMMLLPHPPSALACPLAGTASLQPLLSRPLMERLWAAAVKQRRTRGFAMWLEQPLRLTHLS